MTAGEPPRAGGRRAVVALYLATTVFTLGEGSFLILLSPYLHAQGLSEGAIGPIVAAQGIAALAFRLVAGALYRAHWARYLVPGGCVLSATAFLLIAQSSDPLVLTVLAAMNGIGFATASTGGLAAVMEVRRGANAGSVMAWYTGFIGLGHTVAALIGGVAGDLLGLTQAITVIAAFPLAAAVALGLVLRRLSGDGPAEVRSPGQILSGFRHAGPLVWLAFFVALHMSLLSGILQTYFPLYGLAIGLSLTQIGLLNSLHSALAAGVRFAVVPLTGRISYRPLLPWLVGFGGISVAAMALSQSLWVLAVCWAVIGACRGLLRLSSSALVMDASGPTDRDRGAASGIYMSGLDLGKVLGPLLGGVTAEAVGLAPTFMIAGLSFPAVFFLYSAWLRARTRRAEAGGGA